jgi:carnitine-CoA ligase
MVESLKNLCELAANSWPDKTALIFDGTGERLTFRELNERSNRFANALRSLGIGSGHSVALMLPNCGAYAVCWLGMVKIGAVLVPINNTYKSQDTFHLLEHSEARLIVTTKSKKPLVDSIRPVCQALKNTVLVDGDSDENALSFDALIEESSPQDLPDIALADGLTNIQYTSGTTGLPKGCVLTNSYWLTIAEMVTSLAPGLHHADVLLTAQAFSYIDPQWNLIVSLRLGATLVVLERFSPSNFWSKVSMYDVTFFYCLGAMPTLMLEVPKTEHEIRHKVRKVLCSGIPPTRHAELEDRFGAPWFELYGSTETGCDAVVLEAAHNATLGTGALGTALPHRELRIVADDGQPLQRGSVGELLIRGNSMMAGYFKNKKATAEVLRAGWYHTGDLAEIDDDGYLYLRGRKTDMIRRGGENISAREVEECLLSSGLVSLAAAIAVPDDLRGEELKIYVVLVNETADSEQKILQMISYLQSRLASFKVPRYWEVRASLPLTPSSRVAKHLIEEDSQVRCFDWIEERWLQSQIVGES